jgi:hypothetical protein
MLASPRNTRTLTAHGHNTGEGDEAHKSFSGDERRGENSSCILAGVYSLDSATENVGVHGLFNGRGTHLGATNSMPSKLAMIRRIRSSTCLECHTLSPTTRPSSMQIGTTKPTSTPATTLSAATYLHAPTLHLHHDQTVPTTVIRS